MNHRLLFLFTIILSTAGRMTTQAADLEIADNGATNTTIVVAADAGEWENRAATDLAKYIGLMSGATPTIVNDIAATQASPVLIVGAAALNAKPALNAKLQAVLKKDPLLRADGIVAVRDGNRVYLAGNNDEAHYYAAMHLLHEWGCRWYLPTEIGECIPEQERLTIGDLDYAYGSPFEVRHYWISWNGSNIGQVDFQRRNFMSSQRAPGMGHALMHYTKDLAPEGGTSFHVPFSEIATAEHVVDKMGPKIEAGASAISLAIDDGAYTNDSESDAELLAGLQDKYFVKPSLTDPMMAFYANVGRLMEERYPDNETVIGGMAYVNVSIPPQRKHDVPDNLVMWLAPIDIDPNHGMDSVVSPPRQEYRDMMYRWSEVMDGRVCIYDYDQGMLVWRNIPNPSHMAFRHDVKHYRDAGILGIGTECRNAIGKVFTNLYFRGQLMWDPDADVDAMLAEFYEKFYGPVADPMGQYWDTLYKAWEETIVTEHEYMTAPAIYTREVMEQLRSQLAVAEVALVPVTGKANLSRNEKLLVERMAFARVQFDTLSNYMEMVFAASSDANYDRASEAGLRMLASRLEMANMNPTFTTRVIGPGSDKNEPGGSPAWLQGEVKQYMDLRDLTDGTTGTLVQKLPLEWSFRRDPRDTGLASGYAYQKADLTYWNTHKTEYQTPDRRKDYPTTEWETVRADLYPPSQGILHPDWQSFTGFLWYKTDINLTEADTEGDLHIHCPGLFSESWLWVNGELVGYREWNVLWWLNDYLFEWDVDLTGKLKPGVNDITIRCNNVLQFGGMFRRPFLYRPTAE
jgi:hypothetical protein